MKASTLLLSLSTLLCLSACASTSHISRSRMDNYMQIYAEKPRSIVVMPIRLLEGSHALRHPLELATIKALSEQGYYVISPQLVEQRLGAGGLEFYQAYDPSLLAAQLGADAALYTSVDRWTGDLGLEYTEVGISYRLSSLRSGKVLLDRRVQGRINQEVLNVRNERAESSIAQLLVNLLTSLLRSKQSTADQVQQLGIGAFPYGPYHPRYQVDLGKEVRSSDGAMLEAY